MKYLLLLLALAACSKDITPVGPVNPAGPTPVPSVSPTPSPVPSPVITDPEQLPPEQYQTGYTYDPEGIVKGAAYEVPALLESYPVRFNWNNEGGETPVRNQGGCGSCWAFGSTQMLVNAIKIFDGVYTPLSEQQLVSCDNNSSGCSGGYFSNQYLQKTGLALDSDFPYTASNQKCKQGLKIVAKAHRAGNIGSKSRAPKVIEIKAALLQYGVVAVTVAASRTWDSYHGGVKAQCGASNINHIVNIVGWDDIKKVWIMKNSWGDKWGEHGYAQMPYGCDRIANQAAFVEYKSGVMAYHK